MLGHLEIVVAEKSPSRRSGELSNSPDTAFEEIREIAPGGVTVSPKLRRLREARA